MWGDARINNQIFDDDHRVAAVVDWEMVTLADPMMDVAWWLFLDRHFHEGIPADRLEGFPTREEMIARYEEVSGRETHDLRYYEVLAGPEVHDHHGAAHRGCSSSSRSSRSTTTWRLNNIPSRLTAALLGLPSPGPNRCPSST